MATAINKEELLKILELQKEELCSATSPLWDADDGWYIKQNARIYQLEEIISLIKSGITDIKEK